MLGSREDAEDVLQEVFTSAHSAMLADTRAINARPWLYRIARNRCLNHLRKPVADGQDSMDVLPHANGATTAELAQDREHLREIVADVQGLPETQRTALVLREIDDLSYDEIAVAMETTVSAVKSLLVRARMGLAEASESRILSCDDVRLQLAEAAEGLRKVSGPARHHIRGCADCRRYREGMRTSTKALAALAAPIGLLGVLREVVFAKLGGGGAGASAGSGSAAAGGGGGCAAGGGAVASGGAAAGAGGAAAGSGIAAAGTGMTAASAGGAIGSAGALAGGAAAGGIGGVLGGKAAAGVATAALLTAGAAGVAEQIGIPEGRSDNAAKSSAPADENATPAPADSAPAGEAAPGDGMPPAPPAGEGAAASEPAPAAAAEPKGHKERKGHKNGAGKNDENPLAGGGEGEQPPPVVGGEDPPPPPPPPPDEPPPPPPPADPPPPPPAA